MTKMADEEQKSKNLKLKIEPSFGFKLDYENSEPSGTVKISREEDNSCLDISFYNQGRLCLSPFDSYYDLQENEYEVDRSIPKVDIVPFLSSIAQRLAGSVDRRLTRVHEIHDAFMLPADFKHPSRDYLRLTSRINGVWDILFILNNESDELVKQFWSREYPEDGSAFPDKLLGNSFSIYFMESCIETELGNKLERIITPNFPYQGGENQPILDKSEYAIMSLSYGYRMRTLGFSEEELSKCVSS